MSKILAVTGLTGKKSGGVFAELLAQNIDEVRKMFPDGIRALVRATSNTDNLIKRIPYVQICMGGSRLNQ